MIIERLPRSFILHVSHSSKEGCVVSVPKLLSVSDDQFTEHVINGSQYVAGADAEE